MKSWSGSLCSVISCFSLPGKSGHLLFCSSDKGRGKKIYFVSKVNGELLPPYFLSSLPIVIHELKKIVITKGPCHVMVLFQLWIYKTASTQNNALGGALPWWVHSKGILRMTSLNTDHRDYNQVPQPLICQVILTPLTVPGKRTTRLALTWRESGLAEAPSINSARLVSAVPVVWWGEFLTCVHRIMFPCHLFIIWLWATYVSWGWLYTDAGNNTSWVLYDIRSCMWHRKHPLMIKHHHGARSTLFQFEEGRLANEQGSRDDWH